MPCIDLDEAERVAMAMGWQAVKLARATPTAVAVAEFEALHRPINVLAHKFSQISGLAFCTEHRTLGSDPWTRIKLTRTGRGSSRAAAGSPQTGQNDEGTIM
jgi:hypothetical protein